MPDELTDSSADWNNDAIYPAIGLDGTEVLPASVCPAEGVDIELEGLTPVSTHEVGLGWWDWPSEFVAAEYGLSEGLIAGSELADTEKSVFSLASAEEPLSRIVDATMVVLYELEVVDAATLCAVGTGEAVFDAEVVGAKRAETGVSTSGRS